MIIAAIPAFNEEGSIARIVIGARKYVDQVIVVDDGSTDNTGTIAKTHGAMVIRHPENQGYGAAIRTIFEKAKELQADQLVILDADGQHDPEEIPTLLSALDNDADAVIGSRFLGDGHNLIPTYRKLGMKSLDFATNIAGNIDISDSQSGFRAYGRSAINSVKPDKLGMSGGSAILIQMADQHMRIREVPVTVRYDLENTSSANPVLHGCSVLASLIGMILHRRPFIFIGLPGGIMALSGFFLALPSFITMNSTFFVPDNPSLVAILLITGGLLLVIASVMLGSDIRMRRPRD